MPEISVARTITVLTIPEESRVLIRDGKLAEALNPELFGAEEQEAMDEVRGFVDQLSETQSDLLLLAMQNAVDEEQGHNFAAHFLQLDSGYEIGGTGLEIRNDAVTEEKVISPVRVVFVSWQPLAS